MILPHPESDLSTNIMVLGTEIIRLIKGKGFLLIEDVMNAFVTGDKKRTPDIFLFTLTFLFACGFIEKKGYKIKLIQRKPEQMTLFQ